LYALPREPLAGREIQFAFEGVAQDRRAVGRQGRALALGGVGCSATMNSS